MELVDRKWFLQDVANHLGTDRDTVTLAVRYWHESRGLEVPDGRKRYSDLVKGDLESASE